MTPADIKPGMILSSGRYPRKLYIIQEITGRFGIDMVKYIKILCIPKLRLISTNASKQFIYDSVFDYIRIDKETLFCFIFGSKR